MQTVLLVDHIDGGHHLNYMGLFCRALLGSGCRVQILYPDVEAVREMLAGSCPETCGNVHIAQYDWPPLASPIWRIRNWYVPLARWYALGKACRRLARSAGARPDRVFLCWADDFLRGGGRIVRSLLPLVFPYKWSGLYFHPRHTRCRDATSLALGQEQEATIRARSCLGVGVLDEGAADRLAARIGKPVAVFPDPTDLSLPATPPGVVDTIRRIADGRRIIGLTGVLTKRKGVLTLIDVASRSVDRNWLFVFAGEWDAAVKSTYSQDELQRIEQMMVSPPPNVRFLAGRVEEESELNAVVGTFDVLFLAYHEFPHSSGFLAKAALSGVPVIVSCGYCMEERVRRFRLGVAVEGADPSEVSGAIERVIDSPNWYEPSGPPDFVGYLAEHSDAKLPRALLSCLDLEHP